MKRQSFLEQLGGRETRLLLPCCHPPTQEEQSERRRGWKTVFESPQKSLCQGVILVLDPFSSSSSFHSLLALCATNRGRRRQKMFVGTSSNKPFSSSPFWHMSRVDITASHSLFSSLVSQRGGRGRFADAEHCGISSDHQCL